jgi:hypothetical protein
MIAAARVNSPPTWAYPDWNRAFLRYFFADNSDAGPVTRLDVTAEALLACTRGAFATPEDARQALRGVFEQEHRTRTFHAVLADDDGWRPRHDDPPPFVVHLIVSCMVASEGEGGNAYLERLAQWCPSGVIGDTRILAQRWDELSSWLSEQRKGGEAYRELVLPPRRRGWHNIGYSLDLAFPPRKDFRTLEKIFADEGLLGTEPTPQRVIAAVERCIGAFGPTFQEVFRDFVSALKSGEARWTHVLWLTARAVALSGSRSEEAEERVQLRMTVEHGRFAPFICGRTREDLLGLGFDAVEFESDDPTMPWVASFPSSTPVSDYERPVVELLSERVNDVRLRACARSGAFVFEPTGGNVFVACGPYVTATGQHALVRQDRVERFLMMVRGADTDQPPSPAPSLASQWVQVSSFRPALQVGSDDTGLRPPVLSVRAGSGVRIVDGWFGAPRALPVVDAAGATQVSVTNNGTTFVLEQQSDGDTFTFPERTFEGEALLAATFLDPPQVLRRRVRFYCSAAHSAFKPPTDTSVNHAFVEGGTSDIITPAKLRDSTSNSEDLLPDLRDAIYLGPRVGEICLDPTGCDWRLVLDELTPVLQFVGDLASLRPPVRLWSPSKKLRRLWRTAFAPEAYPEAQFPTRHFEAYRRMGHRQSAQVLATMPLPDVSVPNSGLEELRTSLPSPHLDDVIEAVAALSARQAGVAESTIIELVARILQLSRTDRGVDWDVVRAWVEVGILDQLDNWRWSGRRYYARRPHLVVMSIGGEERAVVSGLLTSACRMALEDHVASHSHLSMTYKRSVSPYVPAVPVLVTKDPAALAALERTLEFSSAMYLPPTKSRLVKLEHVMEKPRYAGGPFVLTQCWEWSRCYFAERAPAAAGVELVRRCGPGQPDHYEILVEGQLVWATVSRTWAFLAAHWSHGSRAFVVHGNLLDRTAKSRAYLPLPLCRSLAALSPVLSGPLGGPTRSYRYAFPSCGLIRWASTELHVSG